MTVGRLVSGMVLMTHHRQSVNFVLKSVMNQQVNLANLLVNIKNLELPGSQKLIRWKGSGVWSVYGFLKKCTQSIFFAHWIVSNPPSLLPLPCLGFHLAVWLTCVLELAKSRADLSFFLADVKSWDFTWNLNGRLLGQPFAVSAKEGKVSANLFIFSLTFSWKVSLR